MTSESNDHSEEPTSATEDNASMARFEALIGEPGEVAIDPFDEAELDLLLATLADPTTWDDPPAELRDRIVAEIAEIAEQSGAAVADETVVAASSPAGGSRQRRMAWIGPALLGAAAAGLVAVAVVNVGGDTTETASDARIEIVGTDLEPGISGVADIEAVQSGLRIQLELPGLPRRDGGDFYEAWLRNEAGDGLIPIGTFHDGEDVTLWAGVALGEFPIITITRESVAGPKAPEQGSSGDVVARGQLTP